MSDHKQASGASIPPPPLAEASAYPAATFPQRTTSARPSTLDRSSSKYDIVGSDSNSFSKSSLDQDEQQLKLFMSLTQKLRQQLSTNDVFIRPPMPPVHVQHQSIDSSDAATTPAPDGFKQSTTLFNSAAPLAAWVVVRPACVDDVIRVIKFCAENKLSPSVRSGGFATAGWSIQGDVVLDMRAMNKIGVVPSTLLESAPVLRQCNPAAQANRGTAKGRAAVGDDGFGSITDEAVPKRRRGEVNHQKKAKPQSDASYPGLPLTASRDSGADADVETSSGSNKGSSSRSDEGSEDSDEKRHDGFEADKVIAISDHPVPFSSRVDPINTTTRYGRIERADSPSVNTPQSNDNGSSDPSRGSTSAFGEIESGSTTATSADLDLQDFKVHETYDGPASGATGHPAESLDAWASGELENQQRQNYEGQSVRRAGVTSGSSASAPASASGASSSSSTNDLLSNGATAKRLILPSSGGFVWTAGDEQSGSLGTTRPLTADENVQMNTGPQPPEQQRFFNASGVYDNAHSSATPGLSAISLGAQRRRVLDEMDKGAPRNTSSQQNSTSDTRLYVRPGIHKDKFILVEFEPGAGVRDVDIYTDHAGRSGSWNAGNDRTSNIFTGSDSKGKLRADESTIRHAAQSPQGLDITLSDGVPYHVPLSAYPVGSTAMTIGGFGYLSRAYGLSLDNIVELDLVLADGRLKTLNAKLAESGRDAEASELWWAVRGAAPCFGVVTRIVAKAYPVPLVYAGNLIYPFNPATAPSLLRHWRDCLKGTGEQIPRELYSNLILTAGPPDESGEHVIVIQVCYLGTGQSEEIGHSFVQAITSWTGERVLLKDVAEKSFLSQQDGVAQVLKSGQGRRWMVRGDLLTTLTDEVIARSVEQFCTMGNRAVWLFELVGGAIEDRIEANDTCVGEAQRRAKFTAAALQQWVERGEDGKCIGGVEDWLNDVLAPVSVGGPFAAFLERGETRSRCQGSFGKANFERLLQIKRDVDPNGMFRHTFGRGLVDFAVREVSKEE